VLLTDKLSQVKRTHPISQWTRSVCSLLGMIFEYIHVSKTFGFRVIR
jgi:hypothetical protein